METASWRSGSSSQHLGLQCAAYSFSFSGVRQGAVLSFSEELTAYGGLWKRNLACEVLAS